MTASDYMDMYSIIKRWEKKLPGFDFQYGDPLEHIYLFRNNFEAMTAAYEIKSNGDILLSSYLPYTFGNVMKNTLTELWDMGLKDVWRRKDFLPILKKINTLEDICNQVIFCSYIVFKKVLYFIMKKHQSLFMIRQNISFESFLTQEVFNQNPVIILIRF